MIWFSSPLCLLSCGVQRFHCLRTARDIVLVQGKPAPNSLVSKKLTASSQQLYRFSAVKNGNFQPTTQMFRSRLLACCLAGRTSQRHKRISRKRQLRRRRMSSSMVCFVIFKLTDKSSISPKELRCVFSQTTNFLTIDFTKGRFSALSIN